MKLNIISPKWPEHSLWGQIVFRFPYLSLTSLAALTDDKWEVAVIDENCQKIDFSNLPDLVAISLMTPLANRGYKIADQYRSKGVTVILGGIHPTMMPGEAAAHADSLVIGEAEATWPQLLNDFKHNQLKTIYRPTGFHPLVNMKPPKRDILPPKTYFFTNTVQTTRGCPFNCDFCSVTSFYGRTYRTRPVAEVIREIEPMAGRHIFFVDDNIVGKPSYAKELFKAIEPLKIRWLSQASLSIAQDRQLLRLAQKSGCKGLFIGFESLSQENLKAMGKSVNQVKKFREAIKQIHDYGIGIQGSFIFGNDHDDQTVFEDVVRFVEKSHLETAIFSVLTPFPGTRIYDRLKRENRIINTNWDLYDMNHVVFKPARMTPEQLQKGLYKAYEKLYGIPSIIKRLFPLNKNSLFFGIQNYGFRMAWLKTIKQSAITKQHITGKK